MRELDRLRLLESPDHPVLRKPWEYDVLAVDCTWRLGDEGSHLLVRLSRMGSEREVVLHFSGVTGLELDGVHPLVGLRILDTAQFLPEIPAPVCVLQRSGLARDPRPYFWARAVEIGAC